MYLPPIAIAGVKSGVGKTTIATGLMAALTRLGFKVQGFKVGPGYIDPTYHTAATGRISRNLDGFMLSSRAVRECFFRACRGADVAVIEGVMGLFDGRAGSGSGSTAEICRLLQVPVVLVVNVSSLGQSAAAMVWGHSRFDPEVEIAGVILNRVASPRHGQTVKEAVEGATGIPVVGALGRDERMHLPSRHLGLVPAVERGELAQAAGRLGEVVGAGMDLRRLVELARSFPRPLLDPGCLSQWPEMQPFTFTTRRRWSFWRPTARNWFSLPPWKRAGCPSGWRASSRAGASRRCSWRNFPVTGPCRRI